MTGDGGGKSHLSDKLSCINLMATVDIRPQFVLKSQLRSDKERPARMLHFCNLKALKTDLKNTACS